MTRLAVIAVCSVLGAAVTGGASSSSALTRCRASQLRLSGRLHGATQSLLGTLTVANATDHACALPVRPSRVALVIGPQLLPALTVRMSASASPPGSPTRRLSARGRVFVGIQWRNWCGAPRGNVRLRLGLTVWSSETRRPSVGIVRTPQCVDNKYSSRVAVSRFMTSR
jgi:hypothetical protein